MPFKRDTTLAFVGLGYNQARYIDAFVERLRPQRDQFDEIMFVDNHGQDDSESRFSAAGLGTVLRRGDRSTPRALMDIMSRLRSQWVMVLAVDDLLKPDAGRLIRETLGRIPRHTGQVHGSQNPIDDAGGRLPSPRPLRWRVWPAPWKGLAQFAGLVQPCQPGILYRREAVLLVAAREEEWIEDWGLTVRLGLRFPSVETDACWVERRIVPTSFGSVTWPLENAVAVSRHIIALEEGRSGLRKKAMQALAAYNRSRVLVGQRSWRSATRFAVESLSLAPYLPLGLHTLYRALQQANRGGER